MRKRVLFTGASITFFMHKRNNRAERIDLGRVYLEMRAAFVGLLVCSWVGVLHASLVSPSMLHHGPLLTQVTLEGVNHSEVYHVYSVTYATAWSREFCVMAASASANGFGLNVLGEGRQAHFDRDRFLDKLWALRDFVVGVLNTTPEDMRNRTLILFFDGYDVLVNGQPRTLVKRFVHSKKKILISAEKGCCGTREALAFKDNTCDPIWPSDTHTTTPFLNSGAFVGLVMEVERLLTAAKHEYEHYIAKLQSDYGPIQPLHATRAASKGPWDPYLLGTDQLLICQLFAHEVVRGGQSLRSAIGMSLDYESQIFVSAYRMEIGREIVITAKGRVRYFAVSHDLVTVKETDSRIFARGTPMRAGLTQLPISRRASLFWVPGVYHLEREIELY